jgi:hypothetical protein
MVLNYTTFNHLTSQKQLVQSELLTVSSSKPSIRGLGSSGIRCCVSWYSDHHISRQYSVIFELLGCYAALIGSYRRFGTACRSHVFWSSSPRRLDCLSHEDVISAFRLSDDRRNAEITQRIVPIFNGRNVLDERNSQLHLCENLRTSKAGTFVIRRKGPTYSHATADTCETSNFKRYIGTIRYRALKF